MSMATTTVEVAFSSNPLSGSYIWTDITDYVKDFDTKRGRSYELDQMQAGTAKFTLDNSDGRFTPGLSSSPYYPNVLPRRRVRVSATDPLAGGGTVAPVFDASANGATGASFLQTIPYSHTVGTGSNRALFVYVGFETTSEVVTSITYGGVNLSFVAADQSGTLNTDRRVELWQLLAPASGAANVVVNITGSNTGITSESISMTGVNQTTPLGTAVTGHNSSATTLALAPSVPSGSLVLAGYAARATGTMTPTGFTTSQYLLSNSNNGGLYGTAAGNTSAAWSGSDTCAGVSVAVLGISSGGPTAIFTGFVESWAQSFPGGGPASSTVDMTAVDGFKQLGQAQIQSPYAAAVIADDAYAFYPLSEATGSTQAADFTGTYGPAVPQLQPGTTDSAVFGTNSVLTGTDGTGLTLEHHSGGTRSPALQIATGNPRQPVLGTTGSVEFWYRADPAVSISGDIHLFGAHPANTDVRNGGIELRCATAGSSLTLFVADGTTTRTLDRTTYVTPTPFIDGNAHQFVIAWSPSGVDLYYDGALAATDATTVGWPVGPPAIIHVGSLASGPVWYSGGSGFTGVIQGVALFNARLTAAQVANHYQSGAGVKGQDESTRMGAVLDMAAWPSADRLLDAGVSALSGRKWEAGTNALGLIQGFAQDAGGYVFINGAGQLVYHARAHRWNPTSKFTFSESAGTGVEGDVQFHVDDSNLRNLVTVSNGSNSAVAASNPTSIATYGTASSDVTLNIVSLAEAMDAANWSVALNANPKVRCDQVTFEPVTSDPLWNPALTLEIGDTVTLAGLPASAPASSLLFVVESISHKVDGGVGALCTWQTVLQLSPPLPFGVLTLDDPVYGELDDMVLGY